MGYKNRKKRTCPSYYRGRSLPFSELVEWVDVANGDTTVLFATQPSVRPEDAGCAWGEEMDFSLAVRIAKAIALHCRLWDGHVEVDWDMFSRVLLHMMPENWTATVAEVTSAWKMSRKKADGTYPTAKQLGL